RCGLLLHERLPAFLRPLPARTRAVAIANRRPRGRYTDAAIAARDHGNDQDELELGEHGRTHADHTPILQTRRRHPAGSAGYRDSATKLQVLHVEVAETDASAVTTEYRSF